MRSLLVLAFVALSTCSPQSPPVLQRELERVRSADPATMLREALRSGRIEFLEVCGLGCGTPNLGVLTYHRCYGSVAKVRTIDSAGDVIVSDLQETFKREAARLAESYNPMLVAALDSLGKRSCGSTEQWDELWRAMQVVAEEVPQNPYVTSILASVNPRRDGYDFQLHVPDSLSITGQLFAHLCSLPQQFGIAKVQVKVTTGDINNGPEARPGFSCTNGKVQA
jgi:hypothetical protein